jgi:polar amino acid transport system substrate-binding protein
MKLPQILLVAVISVAVTMATVFVAMPRQADFSSNAAAETAYARVMRTGEIRCGYAVYAPYFTKDPATGAYGGIWHDFTEAVADHLGLKVVWAEEVGLGDIGTALDAHRIDVFCGGLWTAGKRERSIDFLRPSAFEPILAYVRADDHRFDAGIDALNDPAIRVSSIDGEGGGLVAAEDFPKATMVSLPQMATYADMFNQVVTGKADVLFAAPSGASVFLRNNPGTLRPLPQKLRVFPVSLAVRYGETDLRDLLDQAQDDVIFNGRMDSILSQYELNKGDFLRVAKPYQQQP